MVLDALVRKDRDAIVNEKSLAGFVVAALIAPLVAVCCVGPVVLGSLLGGLVGWLGGLDYLEVAGANASVAVAVYAFLRWRRPGFAEERSSSHPLPPDNRTLRQRDRNFRRPPVQTGK